MAGGGAKAGGGEEITLEHTPTWIVAAVCSVIVVISLLFERLLHRLGKRLKKSRKKPLYEALLKVKEALMPLGFISLLLNVFQRAAQRICVRQSVMRHLLPCKPPPLRGPAKTAHYGAAVFTGVLGGTRRLLAGGGASDDYCLRKIDNLSNLSDIDDLASTFAKLNRSISGTRNPGVIGVGLVESPSFSSPSSSSGVAVIFVDSG